MPISVSGFAAQLLAFIGADAGITNLVGTRFYYGRLPQLDSFPALVFSIINVDPLEVKTGASTYDVLRVQFDCYDLPETSSGATNEVEALYDAVRSAFDRFKDESGSVKFHHTKFIGRTRMVQDFETKVYSVSLDFEFHLK